ncbi:putative 60S ribosomal protein L28e [Colletotrichum spaethianum]|uniref:60S ribosomal protein L28e n=1 Tax=Colletotrichum spaethianum TaxID=700344 RepID=A0AA37L8J3_9PEZI|nr:putative 60S ribosomal protein L28e [Colletotrichum spaethianum]GKT43813.1 putative 60S ribosomal protein L28e [Colletotrichum spaethianum]
MAATLPNVSSDLIWEVVRSQNAFLVNRNDAGGLQLSRDPLNLVNKHSRKAIGVVPNEKGGVKVISKNQKNGNKPAKNITEVTYGGNKSARKTYSAVARQAAASGYRADLREAAVQRVSAIRRAQRPVKATPEKKPRGNKAKKASTETEA